RIQELQFAGFGVVRDGGVAHDGGQLPAQVGGFLVVAQLRQPGGFQVGAVQFGVYAVYRFELRDQLFGRHLADAGDAGDVVGSVAAQRFVFDDLVRTEAVAFHDFGRVVQGRLFSAAVGRHVYADLVRNQLQNVLVAG